MTDVVLRDFLHTQLEEGLALAAASDLVDIVPSDVARPGMPPQRYRVRFLCTGLVATERGAIVEADDFLVGISFRDDHLRAVDPRLLVHWLAPWTVHHPNVLAPWVCLGRTGVGISLVEIVYQLHAIITYTKATLDDALNGEAAAWARDHLHLFPVDRRPLKRRADAAPPGVATDHDFTIEALP
jgi:hypothetical protein